MGSLSIQIVGPLALNSFHQTLPLKLSHHISKHECQRKYCRNPAKNVEFRSIFHKNKSQVSIAMSWWVLHLGNSEVLIVIAILYCIIIKSPILVSKKFCGKYSLTVDCIERNINTQGIPSYNTDIWIFKKY